MNVGFHRGGVGAQPLTLGHGLLLGDLDDSRMDPRSSVLAEKAKGARKTGKIGDGILIEASKSAIKETGPQFSFQLPEGPVFEVFQGDATQEPVRSNGGAAEIGRTSATLGQGLSGQIDQGAVVQQFIQRIEQIVGDSRGLLREGEVEQRSLARGTADHYSIRQQEGKKKMKKSENIFTVIARPAIQIGQLLSIGTWNFLENPRDFCNSL